MLNLTNAKSLLTDIEVLDNFVEYFKRVIKPEHYAEAFRRDLKASPKFLNPIKILSVVSGHDYEFVKGYIKVQLGLYEK